MVKANAYGLGAAPVAGALAAAGARRFFVAHLDEGLQLRPLLPEAEIFVLDGLQPGLEVSRGGRLIPVLNSLGEIALGPRMRKAIGRALPAAIHLDTGMSRLGLPRGEVERLIAEPQRLDGLQLELLMSHLACSDDPEHEANRRQLDLFRTCAAAPPRRPASIPAASFWGLTTTSIMVRPGAAICTASTRFRNRSNPMDQAIVLEGKILQVRDVDRGTTVGRGDAPHREPSRPSGHRRHRLCRRISALGERSRPRLCRGKARARGRARLHGPDHDRRDDGAAGGGAPGAWVELIGPHLPVDEVAERAGTIGYEILTASAAATRAITSHRPAEGRMVPVLQPLGRAFLGFLEATGRICIFTVTAVSHALRPPFYPRLILRQMVEIGYYSLPWWV